MPSLHILVRIEKIEGSSPREVGAWMLVSAQGIKNSIGGGHLEWQAIETAQDLLKNTASNSGKKGEKISKRYALGPSLGQCCGGVVWLGFSEVGRAEVQDLQSVLLSQGWPLALFGGGHVGRAIAKLVADMPYAFALSWMDSRDQIFPDGLPPHIEAKHADLASKGDAERAVAELKPHSHVLIMSFSHLEDWEITAACLARVRHQNDLGFIGLIGSKSKWAGFQNRLRARGFTEIEIGRVTCPIGLSPILGKEPEVIALSAVAQLLTLRKLP